MSNSADDLKLLGHKLSPYATRVRIGLNLKQVTYEFLEEATGSKGELINSELLLNSNPVYKKLPVLIHSGKPISESMIIVQYIDEVWSRSGPSILPSDPYDRAIARFWAIYIDEKVAPLIRRLRDLYPEVTHADVVSEDVVQTFLLLEEAFEKCSKGRDFFGGDDIGYIDIALGCFLGAIRGQKKMAGIVLIDEANTPKLAGWAQRFCTHAAVKDVIPEVDKVVEYIKMTKAKDNTISTTK